MSRKLYFTLSIVIVVILVGLAWYWRSAHSATQASIARELSKIDQDPLHYVNEKDHPVQLSTADEDFLAKAFVDLYFSPWKSAANLINVLKFSQDSVKDLQNPLWQYTYQPFTPDQLNKIADNVNATALSGINRSGMIIQVTQARSFPSILPAYNDPNLVGEGYPFDNWLNTYLYPGMPIRIIQESKDRLWYLIQAPSAYGWVPKADAGFVSDAFMAEWLRHPFVMTAREGVPLVNNNNVVMGFLRKGLIYPKGNEQGQQTGILFPFLNANGEVEIQTFYAASQEIFNFPQMATPKSIALVARTYMGGQYGWGGLYQLRDCSETTSSILANFGFWLPKSSSAQAHVGKFIDLKDLSNAQKIKIISEQGIPFFTLIHMPGHVGIYVGTQKGHVYILQDVWGIHTSDIFGREGREVIGKTIIAPADFTNKFSNIKISQLDRIDRINILDPGAYKDENQILQAVWRPSLDLN